MNVLVVGHGSIGSRHARLLSELKCDVSVASSRKIDGSRSYASLEMALDAAKPEYVVVANRTVEHHPTVERLAQLGFAGLVLVEKPLFEARRSMPANKFKGVFVAYNLRFHPLLQKLRSLLRGQTVVCASIYAGQYLPHRRPDTDYRGSYSASRAAGGGVLRDLSHELDYALWLLGNWQSVGASGGHLSRLEIDSDDVYSLILVTEKCPVATIQVNYLDRIARRELTVITEEHTIRADLMRGVLQVDDKSEELTVDRDYSYLRQHQALMGGETDILCSVPEGLEVLALIEAAERASEHKKWVSR